MSGCKETICTSCLHRDVCGFKEAFLETLNALQDELECIDVDNVKCKYRIGKKMPVDLRKYDSKEVMICTINDYIYYAHNCKYIPDEKDTNLDVLRIYNYRPYVTKALDIYKYEIKSICIVPKEGENVY